jgi:SAM-dependent methyltransferase
MPNQNEQSDQEKSLRLAMDWRWHRPKVRSNLPKGEPREHERPVKCSTSAGVIGAPATHLPFADATFTWIDCDAVFAYVRNDEGLAQEIGRVLAPGGTVHLRVPAAGPLAGFDAFNLHRYLVDITKHGLRPFETAEIGWRRHFGFDDVVKIFTASQFDVIANRRSGLAAGEIARLGGFVAFRWLRPSRNRYRKVSTFAERIEQRESAIAVPFGFWLDVTLKRKT